MNSRRVTLHLPKDAADFGPPSSETGEPIPAWVPTAGNGGPAGAVIVYLLKTAVEFHAPLSAEMKRLAHRSAAEGDADPLEDFSRLAQSLCAEAHEVAVGVAHSWLSHVRVVANQPWLGVKIEPPQQYGRVSMIDLDDGTTLVELGPLRSATIRLGDLALSLGELAEVHDRVERRHEPPPAESLLADARFLVKEADVVDGQRAVLLAAMASEIKTKATMRQRVAPEKADLLEIVLRRMSSLPQLLDQPLLATLGVSLRYADPDLYTKIQRLTELRNQVAHRGVDVTHRDGWPLVAAADELFTWLNNL